MVKSTAILTIGALRILCWKMDYFFCSILFEPLFVGRFDNIAPYYSFAVFAYITVYLCHYTHKSFAKSKADRTSVERLEHSQAYFNVFAVTMWTFHSKFSLFVIFTFLLNVLLYPIYKHHY